MNKNRQINNCTDWMNVFKKELFVVPENIGKITYCNNGYATLGYIIEVIMRVV